MRCWGWGSTQASAHKFLALSTFQGFGLGLRIAGFHFVLLRCWCSSYRRRGCCCGSSGRGCCIGRHGSRRISGTGSGSAAVLFQTLTHIRLVRWAFQTLAFGTLRAIAHLLLLWGAYLGWWRGSRYRISRKSRRRAQRAGKSKSDKRLCKFHCISPCEVINAERRRAESTPAPCYKTGVLLNFYQAVLISACNGIGLPSRQGHCCIAYLIRNTRICTGVIS